MRRGAGESSLIPFYGGADEVLGVELTPVQRLLLFPGTALAEIYTMVPARPGSILGLLGVADSGKTTLSVQVSLESALIGRVKKIYMVHTEGSELQARSLIDKLVVAYRTYYRALRAQGVIDDKVYGALVNRLSAGVEVGQVTVPDLRGLLDELGVSYSMEFKRDKHIEAVRSIEYVMLGIRKDSKYYQETGYSLIIDSLSTVMRVMNSLPFYRARGSILSSIHKVLGYYASERDALIIPLVHATPRFSVSEKQEDYTEYSVVGGRDQLFMIKAGVLMSVYDDDGTMLSDTRRLKSFRGAIGLGQAHGYAGFLNPTGLYPARYSLNMKGLNYSVSVWFADLFVTAIKMCKQGMDSLDKAVEALRTEKTDKEKRAFAELLVALARHSGVSV